VAEGVRVKAEGEGSSPPRGSSRGGRRPGTTRGPTSPVTTSGEPCQLAGGVAHDSITCSQCLDYAILCRRELFIGWPRLLTVSKWEAPLKDVEQIQLAAERASSSLISSSPSHVEKFVQAQALSLNSGHYENGAKFFDARLVSRFTS